MQLERSIKPPSGINFGSLPWDVAQDMLLFGLIPHDKFLVEDRQFQTGSREVMNEQLQALHGNDTRARRALNAISPAGFNHGACDIVSLTSRIVRFVYTVQNQLFVPGSVSWHDAKALVILLFHTLTSV